MLISCIAAAGSTWTEDPPGITALSLRPFQMPPASANKSLNGTPNGSSKLPGLATWPETENIAVPPEFGGPKPANQIGPLRRIVGTEAKLCVLLILSGFPYRPDPAG